MKILITGGAGFIGSHVAEEFINSEYEVVVLDNLSTGKIENIPNHVKFLEFDIIHNDLSNLLKSEKPQAVVHLAAQPDVSTSIKYPVKDAKNNILGSINLFESCVQAEIEKIIYISTAAVYGEPKDLPVSEAHPIAPGSPYGKSKYIPEMYLKYYRDFFSLDYTILRIANAYGPRQVSSAEGGVASIFMDKLFHGEKPVIYGDGKQTRDFIYVKDIARAVKLSLENNSKEFIYNVSTSLQISINELLNTLKKLLNNKIEPILEPAKKGDIKFNYLDNSKIKKNISWEPLYSLQEGLEEMVSWKKECMKKSKLF